MAHASLKNLKFVFVCMLAMSSTVDAGLGALDYVNPFIGTSGGGNVFPGATLPFGMAKACADTSTKGQGGFSSDSPLITGFSHMHDSGNGGPQSLGIFPLWVQPSCPDDELNQCKYQVTDRALPWLNGTQKASPGYFSISLNGSVRAEMTTTNHSALYKFTFPGHNGTLSPLIHVDLNNIGLTRSNGTASVDPKSGRLSGTGTFSAAFGIGTYDAHFCVDFHGAEIRDTGVWKGVRAGTSPKQVQILIDGTDSAATLSAGTFVRFQAPVDNAIYARVGISFISVNRACSNALKEQPLFDFNGTVAASQEVWRDKLSVVTVNDTGVSTTFKEAFWSGIYRSMISPQDYTGENPLWESDEPYYDSYYCIWDSFRATHPALVILDPLSQSRMVRSLVDIYRHEGYLPDCRMTLCKGSTQGGSNADVVIVDSYLKNITGVDWATAYDAIVKDADVEPLNWGVEGRGGLSSWKSLNYIPTDDFDPFGVGPMTRSISRTVEYAYDDFCIAQMAKGLGKVSDYEKYSERSTYWANMFKEDQTSVINDLETNFTGFLQSRYLNGTWGSQDPAFCSPLLNFTSCYLNAGGHETYEGSTWMYTFYVPQDMAYLITKLGGPANFISRLEFLHSSGLIYIGDEQAFLPTFQYHYGGRPGLSSKQSHAYIPSKFNSSTAGLAGNDDSGAMGSFVFLSMLGLWPVAGQDVYLINPPYFKEVSIRNRDTGKIATIRNQNFDPSYNSIYIQSATRDGKPWTKNWISHDFFTGGGLLELTLGIEESAWGTAVEDLPPSLSTDNIRTT